MKNEQTLEQRKQQVIEYITQVCFEKNSVKSKEWCPMAIYLYQNANLGPKGTKQIAAQLYGLSNHPQERDERFKKLEKSMKRARIQKAIYQYLLGESKTTLEESKNTMASGNFVYMVYHNYFIQKCQQLEDVCQKKENAMIYFCLKDLKVLLDKNRQKQEEIKQGVLNAKARIETLIYMTRNKDRLKQLAEYITELELTLDSENYHKMQETITNANLAFAQATRSASYQKIVQTIDVRDYHKRV